MIYALPLIVLAGCSSVAIAPEVPCDHKDRRTYYAEMPFFASVHVCTKLNMPKDGYSPACAVYNDSEAVIIKPLGDISHDEHERLHAKCGAWHG